MHMRPQLCIVMGVGGGDICRLQHMFGPFADVQFPLLIHFLFRVDCESSAALSFFVWNVHSDATLCGPNCIFVDCQLAIFHGDAVGRI